MQKDAVIYNDVYQDDTWDAVWESAVGRDEGGWTVEMRIPFSQLRFPHADVLTWGVNAQRSFSERRRVVGVHHAQ